METVKKRKGNIYSKHKKTNKINSNDKKTTKKKNIILTFILIISIITAIISILIILGWFKDNNESEKILQETTEIANVEEITDNENTELINPPSEEQNTPNDYWDFIKLPLINVNFDELIIKNKDTVGWINVNNTNINYPVVQTSNNEDYLKKAFDGSKNQAGWIFADYRNNMKDFDQNTIIYGHSRLNSTMFGTLFNVLNRSWYTNKYNHVIKFSTPYENTMWQVFSVYKIEPEVYYITTSFIDNSKYVEFLNTLKSRSIYNFNVELSESDKIITLSTCSDAAGTGRIVLHAKLIKKEVRN